MNRLFRTPASTTGAGANNPPMLEWLIETHCSNRALMWKRVMWLGVALLVGCDDQPTPSTGIDSPAFSRVTVTDPTTVLTVGVNAPANLTLKGTVAAIVIAVDNAVVDLSAATVDCSAQTGPDPKIGLWIKGNRSHAYVKGGGTGVIQNCGIGVLIGPVDPQSAEPGGSNNQVAGLKILAPQAILVSNSHGNLITSNTIPLGGPFGIADYGISVVGKDASAAVSGKNQILNNTVAAGEIAIYVSSEGNTIRGNVAAGEASAAVAVDRDGNLITGNQTTALPGEDPPNFGIQLRQGADSNTVSNNTLRALITGIDLQQGAAHNVIRGNTAIAQGVDAKDENGNCVDNVWANNTFRNSDPLCIVGVTLAAVTFTSPTAVQLDGPGATFNATITNASIARLTGVAIRAWVDQGTTPFNGRRRRLGTWSLVSCGGAPGVFARGSCNQVGETLIPSNLAAGSGTLAVDGATAIIELVHIVNGDTVVMDSRSMPITLAPPATGSYWEIRAPLPTPRSDLAVGVIGGVLYAVGGIQEGAITGTVEAYDPSTNTWTTKAPMPTPRYSMAAGVVNGVLYIVGGVNSNGDPVGVVEAYDPVSNTWTTKAAAPTPRYFGVAAGVVGNVLYVVGGVDINGLPSAAVEAYDPVTDSWTTEAAMPTPRSQGTAAVVNGILYEVGGHQADAVTAVDAYDPVVNNWTTVTPIPTALWGNGAGVINGVLYTAGVSWFTSEVGVVEAYDVAAGTWTTKTAVPVPLYSMGVGVVNGVLYTVGGVVGFRSGTVQAYHP